jgi:hypothetical protein
MSEPTPADDAIVDARYAQIAARLGNRIEPGEEAAIRRHISRSLTISATLHKTPLTNADAPEIVFTPFRTEDEAVR